MFSANKVAKSGHLVGVMVLAYGCAFSGTSGDQITEEEWAKLTDGMSQEEVEGILGRPQGIERDGEAEVLVYNYTTVEAGAFFGEPQYQSEITKLRFVDGKLQWQERK